ncbi:MAG: DUF3775 domain-containing protein, partial [Polyangiaceae bacterium]|nr:DUF3775 domain-containing protein [Polyangiaceae bacterium]
EDPTEGELRSWIGDLAEVEQAELVALMWLGRGDDSADHFSDLVEKALASNTTRTESYLLGDPLFGELIEEGVDALGLALPEPGEAV